MKDITGNKVSNTGNLAQGGTALGFDEEGHGHLMSLLSNIYSNKFLAVLREYACNAWDSHVEAGRTDVPIEVDLPSLLQPTLVIRDFGIGLSREAVESVFGVYGKSTKRNTNDQVGAFGIGSKAAFTLGHQFIVKAVKDGHQTVALFALNDDNVPSVNVISETEVDAPNGVEVSLAVEDVDSMVREARSFFSTWREGTVLVDGEKPESLYTRAQEINPVTHIVPEHEGQIYVTMGQVAYPVGRAILRKVASLVDEDSPVKSTATALADDWSSYSSLFFNVEIGDVDLAPSREALRDTPRTLKALTGLVDTLATTLGASVQSEVDAAPNAYQAALTFERVRDALKPLKVHRSTVTYQGQPIREQVEVSHPFVYLHTEQRWGGRKYRTTTSVEVEPTFTCDLSRAGKTVVVTGVEVKYTDFTVTAEDGTTQVTNKILDTKSLAPVKRFAKRYLEAQDEYANIVVVNEAQGAEGWFVWGEDESVKTLTLEEFRDEIKRLRDLDPRLVNEPSYTTGFARAERDLSYRTLLADIILEGKDIVVFHDTAAHLGPWEREALADYSVVVLLGSQSENALAKRVAADGSVEIVEVDYQAYAKDKALAVLATITDAEKEGIGARIWLQQNRMDSDYRNLHRLAERFDVEITSRKVQDVQDTWDLAEIVAEDVTEERFQALSQALRYTDADDLPYTAYDAPESPDIEDLFPLAGRLIANDFWYLTRHENAARQALAVVNAA